MDPFWIFAALVAAVGAFTDARTGHIPNWLTLPALGAAIVAHGVFREGASAAGEMGFSLLGAITCAALPTILFARGAIGGGDVKLLAALGAICHPARGFAVLTYAFAFGAIVAAGQMAYRGELFATAARSIALVVGRREPARATPPQLTSWFRLGPSIFAGVVLAWGLYR